MSWYNPSIAKARHEDTPRNPVILATCQVIEKKVRRPRRERLPDVRSDEDCRRLIGTLEKPIYRGCFTLI